MGNKRLNRVLTVAAFSSVAFALPLSEWLLTFFIILLILLWIYDGGLKRIYWFKGERRRVLVFIVLWMVYLIWMINTSDLPYGFKELRLKLPLLVFPLVFGLSEPLTGREVKIILLSFIAGVLVSTVYGTVVNISGVFSGFADSRTLSPFISHIRLAIMAVLAIAIAGWYFYTSDVKHGPALLYLFPVLWLIIYIFLLNSLTGIFLLSVVIVSTLLMYALKIPSVRSKISAVILLTLIPLTFGLLIYHEIRSFYNPGKSNSPEHLEVTAGGNPYWHDTSRKDIENGNKVWINICEPELRKQWNLKSGILYDSTDKKGQALRFTLIRYMTSAGLVKDSAGFSLLTGDDILNIEQGVTNREFSRWSGLKTKVYELIWQVDYYRNGGNPSGHSLTQRIEFLKTGWNLFKSRPLFGTGTGDIAGEIKKQYITDNSLLDKDHRFLSHNQFLTFLITFGVTGFIIICFSLFFPLIESAASRQYLSVIFLIITFLSMLWEDSFQTHTGVSFFAYFYSLFIFGINYNEKEKEEK